MYNLATAAAAAGINKSTVLWHIKAGKISATRDEAGGWQVGPAEFHRIFPALKIATNHPPPEQRDATTDQIVAELRAVIADMLRGAVGTIIAPNRACTAVQIK